MRSYQSDVIAAIATASGYGGIGIVRLSGPELSPFFDGILGARPSPRQARYSDFTDAAGEPLDSGIALYFPAPHSFTGEHVLELQGHGGPAVLQLLLQRCVQLGARLAEPGEFTRRAFLNGRLDLAQAESVADLIEASTSSAARAAVRSLRGEFSARVNRLVEELVVLRTFTEATLDFPDEDVEFLREGDVQHRISALVEAVADILRHAREGKLLRDGLRVALVGQPNVGKSSLLNRLAGEEVAIVTPIAGTTRDTIRQAVQIRGVPLHIIDTAGLREAQDEVERMGIARTWRAVEEADLVLVILDARLGFTHADRAIAGRLPPGVARIVVHNKIDLAGVTASRSCAAAIPEVCLSARTGEGIDLLAETMLESAGSSSEPGESFLARERHVVALREAATHLELAAARAAEEPVAIELLAEELRLAQEALAAITGEFTPDDLLGEIFSRFCIGK
jgi:tRNA modification GTPase